jgi:hypothetical protein
MNRLKTIQGALFIAVGEFFVMVPMNFYGHRYDLDRSIHYAAGTAFVTVILWSIVTIWLSWRLQRPARSK